MTTDNRPRCTLAQLRARWGDVRGPKHLMPGDHIIKIGMDRTETWRIEKIEGKDVHLVQVNAEKEET